MPSDLSVDNLRIHDEYVTYTRGTMPPPPPRQSVLSPALPAVIVKSTTTNASSAKPTSKQSLASSKPHKGQSVAVHTEVRVNGKSVPSYHAPTRVSSKAPSKPVTVAVEPSAKVKSWAPPPPAPENMALVPVMHALPPTPAVPVKSSGSGKDVDVVKATAVVKATTGTHVSDSGSKAGGTRVARSKAGSVVKVDEKGDKEKSGAEDIMVTIEETFTRKISFPIRKGEYVKYGIKSGGMRGFNLGRGV